MSRRFGIVRSRMVVKIFLAIALGVGVALTAFAWKQSIDQVRWLNNNTRVSARQLADLVAGAIEHAMLEGNGLSVKELASGFKTRVPDAEIHIYDARGNEVFGEKGPAPPRETLPPSVRAVLANQPRVVDGERVVRGILNEERCAECHPDREARLRGVLAFDPMIDAYRARRDENLARVVTSGFVRVMTGQFDRAKVPARVESYLEELHASAGFVRAVGIYDREGDLSLGKDVPELREEDRRAALQAGAAPRTIARPGGTIQLVPMALEERCTDCHRERNPVRGLLAISIDAPPAAGASPEELEQLIDISLRNIMLSALGRMIAHFLDEVAATGAARDLVLYDGEGREYYRTTPRPPDPLVARAIGSRAPEAEFVGHGKAEQLTLAEPLLNGPKCIRCHGSDEELRGVVTVSLPTGYTAEVREMALRRTLLFSGIALGIIVLVLYVLMRVLVIGPVKRIGDAAEAIGQGELNVKINRADPHGDEVQRLGARMNDMIHGLRTKLLLERFVSKETAKAARGAARSTQGGTVAQVGERRAATVLFTDIRGFTSFSESVPPEQVVEMLNDLLQIQADIVELHGGDIDKYVGDELMAVFHGVDGAACAVRAAIQMVEAVEQAKQRGGHGLSIGAGVASGDMIHGPIGSANRMDFTVIGDVVNTGARLCSAAQPGEVLVTALVAGSCTGLGDIAFLPIDPLKVKGKREALAVYRAIRPSG